MRSVIVAVFFLLGVAAAQACPAGQHEQCVGFICWCAPNGPSLPEVPPLPDLPPLPEFPPLEDIDPEVVLTSGMSLIWEEAARQDIPVLTQVAVNMNELTENLETEFRTAIENTIQSHDKAIQDAAQNILKSTNDVVDATRALGHYAEREVAGWGRILSAADERLREGKIVDAVWHLTTDQWQERNMNAAQLAQESEVAAAAMQSAAYAYGGPAGAAAFAAWQTYNATGSMDMALRAGALSYATSVAGANVGGMEASTLGQLAKKAAMAGAVGGLAVAASGGSDEEALNAFVKSGGAVLVQAGQDYVNENYVKPGEAHLQENYLNRLKGKMDAYCVTATGEDCEAVARWYARTRERVEELEKYAQTKPSMIVSEEWAIAWDRNAIAAPGENQPAVVMTYIGAGSPVREALAEIAELTQPPVDNDFGWVAYRGVGDSGGFFYNIRLDRSGGTPQVGDQLIANRSINVRAAPADWSAVDQLLDAGDSIVVLDIEMFQIGSETQEWVKFSLTQAALAR